MICSLRFEDAHKLARRSEIARATTDVETSVRESDVVCLATHSPTPVIRPEWVKAGAHVSSVGSCPPDGELPKELARVAANLAYHGAKREAGGGVMEW